MRTTKTNQIRTVPITDDIAQGLSNLSEEQQEQREEAGERWQEQQALHGRSVTSSPRGWRARTRSLPQAN